MCIYVYSVVYILYTLYIPYLLYIIYKNIKSIYIYIMNMNNTIYTHTIHTISHTKSHIHLTAIYPLYISTIYLISTILYIIQEQYIPYIHILYISSYTVRCKDN